MRKVCKNKGEGRGNRGERKVVLLKGVPNVVGETPYRKEHGEGEIERTFMKKKKGYFERESRNSRV